jgi:O-antigen ligase
MRALVVAAAALFAVLLAGAGANSGRTALLTLAGLTGLVGLGVVVRFAPRRACDSLLLLFIALVAIPVDTYPLYRAHTGGWPGLRVAVSDICLYLLVVVALLGAFLGRVDNAVPRRVFLWMGLLLLQYGLSTAFAAERMLSLFEIAATLHAFLIAILVANLFRRDLLGWILALVATQVIVHSAFAGAQEFTGRPIGAGWLGGNTELLTEVLAGGAARLRPAGLFSHPIVYATWLVITLPLLAAGVATARGLLARALQIVALLTGMVGLLLTLSRGAWLSSLVAAAVMSALALRCRLIGARQIQTLAVAALATMLVAGAAFGPRIYERFTQSDSGNLEVRFDLNRIALRMTWANPAFGTGLNNFVETMEPYDPQNVMSYFPAPAHNLYLLEAAEAGIPALLLWLGLFASILRTALRRLPRMADRELQWVGVAVVAGLSGLLVSQLADFSYRLEPLRSMIWLDVGLLFAVLYANHHLPLAPARGEG